MVQCDKTDKTMACDLKISYEKLLKVAEYFIEEMTDKIDADWDECGFAETGMSAREAATYLGHPTKGMSREDIDEEVSEIQRAYFTEGEAELDEIVDHFLIAIGEEDLVDGKYRI